MRPSARHLGWRVAAMAVGVSALTGCGGQGDELDPTRPLPPSNPAEPGFETGSPSGNSAESDADGAGGKKKGGAGLDALLPARVRIHPLTRLTRESPTEALAAWQIACHIELRDRFGHVVKGLGRLRVELYRPTTGGSGGSEVQDAVWNIDLREPGENARVYDDLVTRTYTAYLASLPAWLQQWASDGAGDASGAAPAWITLKAYFVTMDSAGRERVLQTSYRLQR